MSTSVPSLLPKALSSNNNLFASIDMGTNSFKLLIVRVDPSTGHFLTLQHSKKAVLLGLDNAPPISHASTLRATSILRKFQDILISRRVPSSHTRLVATSAIRESANKSQFIHSIHETLGLHVDVLSGLDEARLIYLGILQFHPIHNDLILSVDIGGGSTEFVIGYQGKIFYSISLQLGHMTLTRRFLEVEKMREHIRSVIFATNLVSQVKKYNIEKVIGSSGTIRKIEKAVYKRYSQDLEEVVWELNDFQRDCSFNKEDLKKLVERLIKDDKEKEVKQRRKKFFGRRSRFIVAGAILLDEIFSSLGFEEMEVSKYALGEGVIAEMIKHI